MVIDTSHKIKFSYFYVMNLFTKLTQLYPSMTVFVSYDLKRAEAMQFYWNSKIRLFHLIICKSLPLILAYGGSLDLEMRRALVSDEYSVYSMKTVQWDFLIFLYSFAVITATQIPNFVSPEFLVFGPKNVFFLFSF